MGRISRLGSAGLSKFKYFSWMCVFSELQCVIAVCVSSGGDEYRFPQTRLFKKPLVSTQNCQGNFILMEHDVRNYLYMMPM